MKEENKNKQASSNQSLIKGLLLIDILSNFPNGCPLAKLAELSNLNKSTTYRMLQTLQTCGYVKPTNTIGTYRLTMKCLTIGQKTLSSLNILNITSPYLEQLNLNTGETVNLSMRDHHHAVMIYKLEPTTGMMRTRAYIGQRLELYCSAMGKIFMAYEKRHILDDYWEKNQTNITKLTANTIVTLSAMELELNKIRELGYAVDNEENETGVTCLACPIFDINSNVIYSVSISLSTARLNQIGKDILLMHLKQTAQSISKELGA
ncbi:transcriptional regulator [Histophilus somni]|uniref:IclR family transcriptional regulator n=1 Tax=Histophilus somni TaxID=731 RepID=A0A9Q7E7D8_HISSO|nr:IclR family transcriptional regulator [Histophilus somni]ARU65022.1 transcriptional regulator [Histophilus somni]ARU66888.1 transcriptional regulator [Histophilus somni]ARU68759.1 transcriptional regulator [Histophilus somni]ARU70641.1 transcriptional regulator [Histophilus somni]ARU72514.1 transcriptional regulator [Histophilus somni]